MRTHNGLASPDNTGTSTALQFIRRQEQQKASLQEIDAKEEGHEA